MRQTPYHIQDTKAQPKSFSIAAYFNLNSQSTEHGSAKISQLPKPDRAMLDTPVAKNLSLPSSEGV